MDGENPSQHYQIVKLFRIIQVNKKHAILVFYFFWLNSTKSVYSNYTTGKSKKDPLFLEFGWDIFTVL